MYSMNLEEEDLDKERRGTFVGTLNFVAPEMIKNHEACLATDLWSLGCIIFKMLTGVVPFPGTLNHQVFDRILKKDITYPEYISPEAVSLIDSMLMLDPVDRLGSPYGKCNMSSLKKHPFFKGIDFSDPKHLVLD